MPAHKKDLYARYCAMEHRHFATIAAIIRVAFESRPSRADDREDVAYHFANELSQTNPKFDRKRFLAACGVED